MLSVFTFEAIGTVWRIDIFTALSSDREAALFSAIRARVDAFDATYSRFRSDSVVASVARAAGNYILPPDGARLIAGYREMYDRTNGAVTPLIGGVLAAAGYDAAYSFTQTAALETPPEWDEALSFTDGALTVSQPVQLDFGAGGKGYLIDLVGELLEAEGVTAYVINAGGDIRVRNRAQPLKVGLENPFDTTEAVGVATINNRSICGSAGHRRAWGEYHHIMNPKTLTSPRDTVAVWVVAETTFVADLLTTALFFIRPEELAEYYTFEYAILNSSLRLIRSPQFPGTMFSGS